MLIEGSKTLIASREEVWRSLNDLEFLRRSIPGCRRVTETAPDQLDIALTVSVGPIKANFDTQLHKLDVIKLESYTLQGKGSAGAAGSGSGIVKVALSDIGQGTLLTYSAETEVVGRVAQLGARMMDSTARRFAEEFFSNISTLLDAPGAVANETGISEVKRKTAEKTISEERSTVASWPIWKVALACAIGTFMGSFAASLIQ